MSHINLMEKELLDLPFAQKYSQQHYSEQVAEELQKRFAHQPLAFVHSFGCQQNASDSEKLMGMLAEMGYGMSESAAEADLILYNTCAVRENAELRVFGNVGALKKQKEQNRELIVGLCGCMVQQPQVVEKLKESYPFVDLIFGPHAIHTLPELVYRRLTSQKRVVATPEETGEIVEEMPIRRVGTVKAWLPIMYGCNNFCSYCIVPYVRGRERSRGVEHILAEARQLVSEGYKEITLLGQNVNSYGKTLDTPVTFAELLEKLNAIEGDFRIRFMTSHPKDCTKELIDTIARCEKIGRDLHLPVQAGSNRILKEMNRSYTRESYLELIRYAQEKIQDVTFSSDIIVGFPGETAEEFEETLSLVKEVEYERLYTFIYSKRTGTKAADYPDPTPKEEKSRRMNELLTLQGDISDRLHSQLVGKTCRVLVEDESRSAPGVLTGRTDGNVIVDFHGPKELIGSFVDVRITTGMKYALKGELI